jgi:hypothetical protein
MKMIPGSWRSHYALRVSIFLITAALITVMVGCSPFSRNLEIRTWYDLDDVRDNLEGHHTLINDLDSSIAGYEELAGPTANGGKGWEPIYDPDAEADNPFFTGTFDGQGHEIRDLFINRPDEYCASLFGVVEEGGHIENIGVVNVTVTGKATVGSLAGAIAIGATVSDSYSTGSVTGGDHVGGLIGHIYEGTVSNSYSTCSVTGGDHVGGLIGHIYEGTVSNSYSTCSVTGNISVGGLVGRNTRGTVSYSYSIGSVTGGNSSVGGMVGWNEDGTVSKSFWDTQTSGQSTSDGGTGKNTTEMQDIATFSVAGWNIIAVALNETNPAYIWNIVNNVTYPFLSWQSSLFIRPFSGQSP